MAADFPAWWDTHADFGSVEIRAYHPTINAAFIDGKAKLSTHILRFGINRKL